MFRRKRNYHKLCHLMSPDKCKITHLCPPEKGSHPAHKGRGCKNNHSQAGVLRAHCSPSLVLAPPPLTADGLREPLPCLTSPPGCSCWCPLFPKDLQTPGFSDPSPPSIILTPGFLSSARALCICSQTRPRHSKNQNIPKTTETTHPPATSESLADPHHHQGSGGCSLLSSFLSLCP